MKYNIYFLIIILLKLCSSYRILGIYPLSGKSHFIMLEQLFKGLARKGHQVDVISTFQQKKPYPNYNDILVYPNSMGTLMNNVSYELLQNFFTANIGKSAAEMSNRICESMENTEFLNFVKNPPNDPPYDLIITQVMMNHCFMIPGYLWNTPVIGVSTSSLYPWVHDIIGNPETYAYSPNNVYSTTGNLDFFSRLINVYQAYFVKFSYLYYSRPQSDILKKYFGPNIPTVKELENNISLILINSHFPINGVKPMVTGAIEVGGLHIQDDGPELDTDLKKWLDNSKHGFIYFTLGSMFRLETFPKEILTIIFDEFEKIKPMQVLVKIAKPEDLPIKLPSNVKTLPWIPQEKVLQHPNIKLFITHGGLLGTQESIFYGVPMLCMPVIADQWTNAINYVNKKIAIQVNLLSLTSKDFNFALNEILNNPIYRNNMKRISKLFRDRPQNALDTAIYWVEYVIRNGKEVLKSPSMDLYWWQIALFDIYIVTIIFLIIIYKLLIFLLKTLINLIFCKKSQPIPISKKIR